MKNKVFIVGFLALCTTVAGASDVCMITNQNNKVPFKMYAACTDASINVQYAYTNDDYALVTTKVVKDLVNLGYQSQYPYFIKK